MSQAQRLTGENLRVLFQTGGSTYDLSGDYRKFEFDRSVDTVDMSAADDEARYMRPTKKVYKATLEALYRVEATATYAAVKEGVSGTLQWGENGTAVGQPKGEWPCLVKTMTTPVEHEGEISISWTFESQGALISDPTSVTW